VVNITLLDTKADIIYANHFNGNAVLRLLLVFTFYRIKILAKVGLINKRRISRYVYQIKRPLTKDFMCMSILCFVKNKSQEVNIS